MTRHYFSVFITRGNDINPLGCMFTLAKAIPLDTAILKNAHNELLNGISGELQKITRKYRAGESTGLEEPEVQKNGEFKRIPHS